MELDQVVTLLALAAQFDGRKTDDTTAEAWRQVINLYVPDMTFDEGKVAILGYYGEAGEWLMPNMLIEKVRQRRSKIMDRRTVVGGPVHPHSDLGYQVIVRTLAEIRAAGGGDPLGGHVIGEKRCTEITEKVIVEMNIPAQAVERPGQHCGNPMCNCTHTEGCEAGWIEHPDRQVEACIFCTPTRRHILSSTPDTMSAGRALRDPLRNTP